MACYCVASHTYVMRTEVCGLQFELPFALPVLSVVRLARICDVACWLEVLMNSKWCGGNQFCHLPRRTEKVHEEPQDSRLLG